MASLARTLPATRLRSSRAASALIQYLRHVATAAALRPRSCERDLRAVGDVVGHAGLQEHVEQQRSVARRCLRVTPLPAAVFDAAGPLNGRTSNSSTTVSASRPRAARLTCSRSTLASMRKLRAAAHLLYGTGASAWLSCSTRCPSRSTSPGCGRTSISQSITRPLLSLLQNAISCRFRRCQQFFQGNTVAAGDGVGQIGQTTAKTVERCGNFVGIGQQNCGP